MNPIMHIEMAEGGMIDIELFPDVTCNTVRSVIWLANQGFYDGRDFYRVVKDFVLQTDCAGVLVRVADILSIQR